MIIAGERDHNQSTLEVVYDSRDKLDHVAIRGWRDHVDGGVYDRHFTSIVVSDDPVLREQLVAKLAAALGVPYTTTDRRKAVEEDERAYRRGDSRVYADPVWRKQPSWHGLESGL